MSGPPTTKDVRHPATLLCHPVVVMAVVVCAVNDHLFKGSGWLPGVVTGKLSDVAGLFFFPTLLAVLLFLATRIAGRWSPPIRQFRWFDRPRVYLDTAAFLTIAVFAAVNISLTANSLLEPYWGVVTMDVTDLLCLPMVLVGRQFALRRWTQPKISTNTTRSLGWKHWGAIAFAVVVSSATSPAPATVTITGFPHWEVSPSVVHCHHDTEIRGWFARSGKQGAGFVLRLDRVADGPTEAEVNSAKLIASFHASLPRGRALVVNGRPSPRSQTIDGGGAFYIPFEFDNEQAQDDDLTKGAVEITLYLDGQRYDLRFDARHRSGALTDTYSGYQPYHLHGEPVQKWGLDPEQEGIEISGEHRLRSGEYLRRDPSRPGEYGVRFESAWTGGCSETGND